MPGMKVEPQMTIPNGAGSGSPVAAAAAMGASLELLGQFIIDMQSNFADLGKLIADMKAKIAELSQQAQDNFCNSSNASNPNFVSNSINDFIKQVQAGNQLDQGAAGQFSALQQELSSIVNAFQAPDNKVSPLLTSIQNTTQGLPASWTQILGGDSAPMIQGQQTISQLLMKGL